MSEKIQLRNLRSKAKQVVLSIYNYFVRES